MGTKNNPTNRGAGVAKKMLNGKEVKPVFYMGRSLGHGNYMAGQFDGGEMVTSDTGVPTPFKDIISNA